MKRIYLDYAATAPLRAVARDAMLPWLDAPLNPSSLHYEGRQARQALDRARDLFAGVLKVPAREVVFTASGSESISLALLGAMQVLGPRGIIFASAVEHQAVLAVAARMQDMGWQWVTVPVDAAGRVRLDELKSALKTREPGLPAIVSAMLVNNELGTLNDLAAIANIAHSFGVPVHCDAVGAGALVSFAELTNHVDALSLAAHKFGGPLGAAVLWARTDLPFVPIVYGGGQEYGKRAGTENLAAVVGAAAALIETELTRAEQAERIRQLRDAFETKILSLVPDAGVHAASAPRSPGISNLAIPGVAFDVLPVSLDLAGLAVSTGSACASGALKRSHVLHAIGADESAALRFSWGMTSTLDETLRAVDLLVACVAQARDN
jgi:cysteine desulfurase